MLHKRVSHRPVHVRHCQVAQRLFVLSGECDHQARRGPGHLLVQCRLPVLPLHFRVHGHKHGLADVCHRIRSLHRRGRVPGQAEVQAVPHVDCGERVRDALLACVRGALAALPHVDELDRSEHECDGVARRRLRIEQDPVQEDVQLLQCGHTRLHTAHTHLLLELQDSAGDLPQQDEGQVQEGRGQDQERGQDPVKCDHDAVPHSFHIRHLYVSRRYNDHDAAGLRERRLPGAVDPRGHRFAPRRQLLYHLSHLLLL